MPLPVEPKRITPDEAWALVEEGLVRLMEFPFVAHVRGERGGMVWGLEMREHAGRTAADWARDRGQTAAVELLDRA